MQYWIEDHPILASVILALVLIALIVGGILLVKGGRNILLRGNEQILDTNWRYEWAIVQLGNGELIEGRVTSWKDFSESDMIQFTLNGVTYLTHSSNVILCSEEP